MDLCYNIPDKSANAKLQSNKFVMFRNRRRERIMYTSNPLPTIPARNVGTYKVIRPTVNMSESTAGPMIWLSKKERKSASSTVEFPDPLENTRMDDVIFDVFTQIFQSLALHKRSCRFSYLYQLILHFLQPTTSLKTFQLSFILVFPTGGQCFSFSRYHTARAN